MIYARYEDIILPQAQPTGTGAQTLTFRIKQERRRIDSIILRVRVTTAGTTASNAWAGAAGVVKEIRLRVVDPAGSRNAVQVSGSGLMGFVKRNYGQNDRNTQVGYATSGVPVSQAIDLCFPVSIRHPLVQDPFGNMLALPLSARWLGEDPILEVDLNDISTSGIVFGTAAASYTGTGAPACSIQVKYRDIPDELPYIPSELKTDTWVPSTTGSPAYEYSSTGYLSQSLAEGFSGSAFAFATTRATIISSGGQARLEYGRDLLARTDHGFNEAWNDLTEQPYPAVAAANIASSFLFARNFQGQLFFDLLADQPNNDAFSAASIKNLNPSGLGGDKMRLILNDGVASTFLQITNHRFLPAKADDLKLLQAAL